MCAPRGPRKHQLQEMPERAIIELSNMSRLRIPIYFDYASTLCYIAWRIVTPLEDELGFEALWKGVPIAARDFRTKPGRVLSERERQKVLFVAAETGVRVAPPAFSQRITTRSFARRSTTAPTSRIPKCSTRLLNVPASIARSSARRWTAEQ